MNERNQFLSTIRQEPSSANILVFCDWLEEQGDDVADILRHCVGGSVAPTSYSEFLSNRESEEDIAFEDQSRGKLHASLELLMYKMDASQLRWYGANCAAALLPLWEAAFPTDNRPLEAIRRAQQYASGECTQEQLGEAYQAALDAGFGAARQRDVPHDVLISATTAARAAGEAASGAPSSAGMYADSRWHVTHALKVLLLGFIPLNEADKIFKASDLRNQ